MIIALKPLYAFLRVSRTKRVVDGRDRFNIFAFTLTLVFSLDISMEMNDILRSK